MFSQDYYYTHIWVQQTIPLLYLHSWLMIRYTVFLNCLSDDALSKVSSQGHLNETRETKKTKSNKVSGQRIDNDNYLGKYTLRAVQPYLSSNLKVWNILFLNYWYNLYK